MDAWHGLAVAGLILLAGLGFPLPVSALLLAAGAMASSGRSSLALTLLAPPVLLAIGDSFWFFLGRRFGQGLLQTACKVSLERDTCVRKTQEAFKKHGLRALLVSRFIPGLSALASPMAGATLKPFPQFVAFDVSGVAIYSTFYVGLGYLFANQLEKIVAMISAAGLELGVAAIIGLALYAGWKFVRRQLLIRSSIALAIHPAEAARIRTDQPGTLIIDLRGPSDLEKNPHRIAGSKTWREAELYEAIAGTPVNTPIFLFCACPNQASSTKVALLLRRRGYVNARPIRDGIDGWTSAGLPVENESPASVHI